MNGLAAKNGYLSPEEFADRSIFPAFSVNVPMPRRPVPASLGPTDDGDPLAKIKGELAAGMNALQPLAAQTDQVTQLQAATLHQKIGDLLQAQGEMSKALGHYQASLAIVEKFVAA